MAIVEWPCQVSPGIRPFRLAVPDGWAAVEAAGTLLALLGPEVDGFRSNLIVSGRRLPMSVELGAVAERALSHCDPQSFIGPVLDRAGDEHRLAVAVRRGEATGGGRRLVQLAVVTTAKDASPAGLRSVFTLIGTCPEERAATEEPVLTDAISSFATGPLGPPTGKAEGP